MDQNIILIKIIQMLQLEDYKDKIYDLIDPRSITLIFIYLLILSIIFIYSVRKVIINKSELIDSLTKFKISQKKFLSIIVEKRIYILFLIPVTLTTFLILYLPTTYDESFTYVNFINRGIAVSASYYPAPNNHVLFSVISSLINFFDFKTILPFRILSLIFFILSLLMFVKILIFQKGKIKNYYFLLISTFPLTFVFVYQSSLARGYSLLIFLLLINIFLLQKIFREQNNDYLKAFSFISSLAFYTIPSYFFSHLIFCIVILFFKKKSFLFLIKSNLLILLFTIILYFPIIIFQGYDFLFQQNLIERIEYKEIFLFIDRSIFILENEIFGNSIYVVLFTILISFVLAIKYNKLLEFFIVFIVILLSIFLPLIIKSVAPGRTLILVYLLTPILIFLPTKKIFHKISKKAMFLICFFIQFILTLNILNNIPSEKYSLKAERISNQILLKNGNYFSCSNLFDPLFLYYKIKSGIEINKLILSNTVKCDIALIDNYDWIIIDKKRDLSSSKPDYESLTWNIYKK